MPTWTRNSFAGLNYGRASVKIASLAPGNTILRVLFGIACSGFYTDNGTAGQGGIKGSLTNTTSFGLVTTVGPGTETPPSPVLQPGDAHPPTQRWLYLATAAPKLTGWAGTSSTWPVGFRDEWESQETEAQVLATGFTSPNTLNLWITMDTQGGAWFTPTAGDIAWYDVWWSLLTKL